MSKSGIDRSSGHVITKENIMVSKMLGRVRRMWLW